MEVHCERRFNLYLFPQGGVVLAEAQPLTDLQIQQTLLTETAGLTLTARQTRDLNSELDTEPSSPTRLLQNIERQVRVRHLF